MKSQKKTSFAILLILAFAFTGISQSCLPEGIVFDTQAQIDNFQINYPGCTEIEGNVEIGYYGSNITNINGLSNITYIGGDLMISGNTSLSSLNGLSALTFLGGELRIEYCASLVDLTGLEGLTSIGNLHIYENNALLSLSGLNNIDSIHGLVLIWANNALINLTGLNNLTFIENQFGILSNDTLNNLEGLNNLTSIGGGVLIRDNQSLTDLSGLSNLNTASGQFTIFDNDNMVNLSGLEGLNSIGELLQITGNYSLQDLSGLNNLTSVGGTLYIGSNDALLNLSGLNSLNTVGGVVQISNNNSLSSLAGLENVTSINGSLHIANNNALSSLNGLENIEAASINDLHIFKNPSLTKCEVKSVCDYLAAPNGAIEIYSNGPGCSSRQDVESACLVAVVEEGIPQILLNIYPNPSSTQITIEATTPMNHGLLKIISMNGLELNHYQITEPKMVIDISSFPAGVYFVRFTSEDEVKTFKVVKL